MQATASLYHVSAHKTVRMLLLDIHNQIIRYAANMICGHVLGHVYVLCTVRGAQSFASSRL
jgi:hypothetical protein